MKIFTDEQAKAIIALAETETAKKFFTAVASNDYDVEALGTFKVIINTDDRDRQMEIVKPEGAIIDNYLKNPTVLACHNYWAMPIGACLDLKLTEAGWEASGIFAPTEEGQTARKLYDLGILRTTSIGFIPLERDAAESWVITKWELLEFSFVPVPANPAALTVEQAKLIEEMSAKVGVPKEDVAEVVFKSLTFKKKEEAATDQLKTCTACQAELKGEEGGELCPACTAAKQTDSKQVEELNETISKLEADLADLKAGRVLSDKNRKLVASCVETLQGSIAALEDLLKSTEAAPADGDADEGNKGKTSQGTDLDEATEKAATHRLLKSVVSVMTDHISKLR